MKDFMRIKTYKQIERELGRWTETDDYPPDATDDEIVQSFYMTIMTTILEDSANVHNAAQVAAYAFVRSLREWQAKQAAKQAAKRSEKVMVA